MSKIPGKHWTAKEIEVLKELYPSTENRDLVDILGRTINSITKMASKLGIPKNKIWRSVICGYVYVMDKDHPEAIPRGYVAEHRKIMSDHIGRPLAGDEVVHHKNGDTQDNRLCNLQLMNATDHQRLHKVGKPQSKESSEKKSEAMKRIWAERKANGWTRWIK